MMLALAIPMVVGFRRALPRDEWRQQRIVLSAAAAAAFAFSMTGSFFYQRYFWISFLLLAALPAARMSDATQPTFRERLTS